MLINQILRRISSSHFRYISKTCQIPVLNSDPKKNTTHIKSGYITSVRLDSGEYMYILRPNNLKSITVESEVFERLKNHIDQTRPDAFVPIVDNETLNADATISSVEEVMSHNVSTPAQSLSFKQRLEVYSKLGKVRLTTLVVISTIAGTLMAPVPFNVYIISLSGIGTFLTSMAANTVNQILEVPYDSQMVRTRSRPLVLGKLSLMHASVFSAVCGVCGLSMLLSCNPITFGLGLTNLFLYTAIYTPLKRVSIYNTWCGSIVGALPPLIGWSAAVGGVHAGGILLASILFCWQFPHFMALSWNLRNDYSRAGYQMASLMCPKLCKTSALRHSVLITLLCTVAPLIGLTDWCFVIESCPFNLIMCVLAYQFYSNATSSTSRRLFRYTLVHLPIVMTLLILNKLYVTRFRSFTLWSAVAQSVEEEKNSGKTLFL